MTQKRYNEIPKRQKCVNKEEPYIGGAEDIVDDTLGKPQSQVNQDRIEDIAAEVQRAQGAESTLDGKIGAEKSRAEGVEGGLNTRLQTVEQLAEISIDGGDAQIATGADFTNPDATKRAKIPTVGAIVDGLNDGIYDVSKRNPTGGPNSDGKFTLDYILSNADTLIPTGWRHGGMTISFVDSSDNKYVQFRLMSSSFNTTVANWQGVDEEPTAGSENLVKSGGINSAIVRVEERQGNYNDIKGLYLYKGRYNKVYSIGETFDPASNFQANNDSHAIIPTNKDDKWIIGGKALYSYSYLIITDSNYVVKYAYAAPAANTVVEKAFCMPCDGYIVVNILELNTMYIKKLEYQDLDDIGTVCIDGEEVHKENASSDIFLSSLVSDILTKGVNKNIEKTITGEQYQKYGMYGSYYYEGRFVWNVPANDSESLMMMMKIYCKGYDHIEFKAAGSQYYFGVFTDKNGNVLQVQGTAAVKPFKIYTDAAEVVDADNNIYKVDIPDDAVYVYCPISGTKAERLAQSVKLVKTVDVEDVKNIGSVVAKYTPSSGINSLFKTNGEWNSSAVNQFTSNHIPVELLDNIEIVCPYTISSFKLYLLDAEHTLIYQINVSTNRKKLYINNKDIKYIYIYFAYGSSSDAHCYNPLQGFCLNITKYKPSDATSLTQSDYYINAKNISGANDVYISSFVKVSCGDRIVSNNYFIPDYNYSFGIYYYDENFNFVATNKVKAANINDIAVDIVPPGAAYVQDWRGGDTGNIFKIERYKSGTTLARVDKSVTDSLMYDSQIMSYLNGRDYSDAIYINNVAYCVSVSGNSNCCITSTGRYIVVYSAHIVRVDNGTDEKLVAIIKYSDDKGKTWSKPNIISNIHTHAPTMQRCNNGRLLFFFSTPNSEEVDEQLGHLEGTEIRLAYMYSDDNGETWNGPFDGITDKVIAKIQEKYPNDESYAIKSVYPTLGSSVSKNGVIVFPLYYLTSVSRTMGQMGGNPVIYSIDNGNTWYSTDIYQGINSECDVCELQDNVFMILERGNPGYINRKEIYTMNVSNLLEHENWVIEHNEELSAARIFEEASGMGEEGEFAGIGRVRLNDHYAYVYGMQVDDTRNVTLLVTHDLKKAIPVCYLYRQQYPNISRIYTMMDCYKNEILCVTREMLYYKEVRAYICTGLLGRIESIGKTEDIKKNVAPITFSAEDDATTMATKLNSLVALMQSNDFMRDWRDYTLKMAYTCEAQPDKPYDSFTKAAANQGVMYSFKKIEGYFRIRITLPAQNVTSNATTVKFATIWCSGASLHTYNAPIVSRDEEFVVAEYEGNGFAYGEALYVWFYNGVAQSAITTDGVKVEIFE